MLKEVFYDNAMSSLSVLHGTNNFLKVGEDDDSLGWPMTAKTEGKFQKIIEIDKKCGQNGLD